MADSSFLRCPAVIIDRRTRRLSAHKLPNEVVARGIVVEDRQDMGADGAGRVVHFNRRIENWLETLADIDALRLEANEDGKRAVAASGFSARFNQCRLSLS